MYFTSSKQVTLGTLIRSSLTLPFIANYFVTTSYHPLCLDSQLSPLRPSTSSLKRPTEHEERLWDLLVSQSQVWSSNTYILCCRYALLLNAPPPPPPLSIINLQWTLIAHVLEFCANESLDDECTRTVCVAFIIDCSAAIPLFRPTLRAPWSSYHWCRREYPRHRQDVWYSGGSCLANWWWG